MSDPQPRAVVVLAAHWNAGMAPNGEARQWQCECGQPIEMSEEAHRAHVATALSDAGLLAPEWIGADLAAIRQVAAERDAAEAALGRVRAVADRWESDFLNHAAEYSADIRAALDETAQ